jgi:hypothetical protein
MRATCLVWIVTMLIGGARVATYHVPHRGMDTELSRHSRHYCDDRRSS